MRGNVSSGCSTTKSAILPTVSRVAVAHDERRPADQLGDEAFVERGSARHRVLTPSRAEKKTGRDRSRPAARRDGVSRRRGAGVTSSTSSFSTTRHRTGSVPVQPH